MKAMWLVLVCGCAQAQTFDFSGVITSSDLAGVTLGQEVTGTYTFAIENADLSQNGPSSNGINLNQPWVRGTVAGPTVEHSALSVGNFTYQDLVPSPLGAYSNVMGGGFFYDAGASQFLTSVSRADAFFQLLDSGGVPYTIDGLPQWNATTTGVGTFQTIDVHGSAVNGDLTYENPHVFTYSITSLAQAPELDVTGWGAGLTLLFGLLAVMKGRVSPPLAS